jgi:uncharacterized protein YoxC
MRIMEILLTFLIITAILSLVSVTVAIWYLVLRIVKTLENVEKNMERIADDVERVLKNTDEITNRLNNILAPIEGIAKISPIFGWILNLLRFFRRK